MGPSIVYTNAAAYAAMGSHSQDNLYLCRDSKKMYLGDILFSDETVVFVNEKPATLEKGQLYFIDTPADPENGVAASKSFITWDGEKEVDLLGIIAAAAVADVDLSDYVTSSALQSTLNDYVQTTTLQDYVTIEALEAAYETAAVAGEKYATKEELNALSATTFGAFHFVGTVASAAELPADANNGDVYQVGNHEYAYNGTEWVDLGDLIDLSEYKTGDQIEGMIAAQIANALKDYYTKVETNSVIDDKIDAAVDDIVADASEQAFYDLYAQVKAKGYKGTRSTFVAQLAEVLNNTDAIVINEGQSTIPAIQGVDIDSLAEALNSLESGATVTMVSNGELDAPVTLDGVTIDADDNVIEANNKRTTVSGNVTIKNANIVDNSNAAANAMASTFALTEGSSLKIKDSEVDTSTAQLIVGEDGDVVLENVNINSSLAADKAATSYDSKTLIDITRGSITMKDGSIIADTSSDDTCGLYAFGLTGGTTITLGDANTHTGPTIITNSAPIGNNNNDGGIDNIIIYGGYYKSLMTHPQFMGVMYLGASANIEIFDGEFYGGDYDLGLPYRPCKYTVRIHGGTFNGKNKTININYKNGGKGPDANNDQDSIVIDGGRFKVEPPAEYIASGYEVVKNGEYFEVVAIS